MLWSILAAGAVLAALVLWMRASAAPLHKLAQEAAASGDTSALRSYLRARSAFTRPAAYNSAIRMLWDAYQRPLTVGLIEDLGREHAEAYITQYWLDQLLNVEPTLARDLDPEFLARTYQPDVASKCGSYG